MVIYLTYAGREISRASTFLQHDRTVCCISANAGDFFPQKLGRIFFVTNKSKIVSSHS
jgi:hypothetical protein